jgi:hypothetical protein
LTQDLPGFRDPLFGRVCGCVLKNVLSVFGQEVIKACVNLGEEVVVASG